MSDLAERVLAVGPTMPNDVERLVEAVWQCLDDMGVAGRCVCGLAHAELRLAFEPFRAASGDEIYDDWLSVLEARRIIEQAA